MTLHNKDSLRYAQEHISARDVQSRHGKGGGYAHCKAGNYEAILRGEPSGLTGLSPLLWPLLWQSLHRDSSAFEPEGLCGDEAG